MIPILAIAVIAVAAIFGRVEWLDFGRMFAAFCVVEAAGMIVCTYLPKPVAITTPETVTYTGAGRRVLPAETTSSRPAWADLVQAAVGILSAVFYLAVPIALMTGAL